eukprot:3940460-Rhodomonas_salina.1
MSAPKSRPLVDSTYDSDSDRPSRRRPGPGPRRASESRLSQARVLPSLSHWQRLGLGSELGHRVPGRVRLGVLGPARAVPVPVGCSAARLTRVPGYRDSEYYPALVPMAREEP